MEFVPVHCFFIDPCTLRLRISIFESNAIIFLKQPVPVTFTQQCFQKSMYRLRLRNKFLKVTRTSYVYAFKVLKVIRTRTRTRYVYALKFNPYHLLSRIQIFESYSLPLF